MGQSEGRANTNGKEKSAAKDSIKAGAKQTESSDPMIEAGAPSTRKVQKLIRSVPAPPGVVMVAPQTLLRKAEGAQSEGRVGG